MHRINPRCKLILNNQEVDGHIESLERIYDHETSYRLGSRIPEVHYMASELRITIVVYEYPSFSLMSADTKCKLSNGKIYDLYEMHTDISNEERCVCITIDANLVEEENSPVQSLPVETQQVTTGYETPVSESVYEHTWDTLERHVVVGGLLILQREVIRLRRLKKKLWMT